MDPRDQLRRRLSGVTCAQCGRALQAESIRVLAQREELAFVEVRCAACETTTLGVVTGASSGGPTAPEDGPIVFDVAGYGEFTVEDSGRLERATTIDADDVLDMHVFLDGYHGGVNGLIGSLDIRTSPRRRRSATRWTESAGR